MEIFQHENACFHILSFVYILLYCSCMLYIFEMNIVQTKTSTRRFVCFVVFSVWYPGSSVVLDCIDF